MELQKARVLIVLGLAVAPAWALRYEARHEHLRKGCTGTLAIDEQGVSFEGPKKHSWRWSYQDIQRLTIAPNRVSVLTYKDNAWKLGADREYRFHVAQTLLPVYALLKDRLDRRLVTELADDEVKPLWEIPVKHLGRIRGSEGVLAVGEDRIVYQCAQYGESRTWRYDDIGSISSSGPFQLTLTTVLKAFNFQLKQPLDEARYNDLWRRLNRKKGTIRYD